MQVLNEQSTLGEDLQAIMADMPTAITQNI